MPCQNKKLDRHRNSRHQGLADGKLTKLSINLIRIVFAQLKFVLTTIIYNYLEYKYHNIVNRFKTIQLNYVSIAQQSVECDYVYIGKAFPSKTQGINPIRLSHTVA